MPHADLFEEVGGFDVFPSVAADAVVSDGFDKGEVIFLIQFIFDDQANVIKMTSRDVADNTGADVAPTEQDKIASLYLGKEFLLGDTTKFPEVFLWLELELRFYV